METQKKIKYIAIGIATILIIGIVFSFYKLVIGINNFLDDANNDPKYYETTNIDNDIKRLKINLKSSKLRIEASDSFSVSTNNKLVDITVNNNNLEISERPKSFFSISNKFETIIKVPEDLVFDSVEIEAGVGEIKIKTLSADKIDFELGAGKASIDNLNAYVTSKIEAGAGLLDINNSTLNNLDLSVGAGEVKINGNIVGSSDIEAGIGSLKISLTSSEKDYKFIVSKGIGEININNKSLGNGTYGDGFTRIKIDGGVGSINITTNNYN